jgi:hypothetical protein
MRGFAVYQSIGLTGAQLAHYIVLSVLLLLVAWLVRGQMARTTTYRDAVMRGFGGLGLFVGLILGLSASPIVNAFVGAAFTLAGVLVPIYAKNPTTGKTTKWVLWIMPFGFFAAIGVLAGITIHANDLLSAPRTPMQEALLAEGFTKAQVDGMLNRWAEKSTPTQVLAPEGRKSRSVLLSSGSSDNVPNPPSNPPPKPTTLSIEMRKALANPKSNLSADQRLTLLSLDPDMKAKIDQLRVTFSADDALAKLNEELSKQK